MVIQELLDDEAIESQSQNRQLSQSQKDSVRSPSVTNINASSYDHLGNTQLF